MGAQAYAPVVTAKPRAAAALAADPKLDAEVGAALDLFG